MGKHREQAVKSLTMFLRRTPTHAEVEQALCIEQETLEAVYRMFTSDPMKLYEAIEEIRAERREKIAET